MWAQELRGSVRSGDTVGADWSLTLNIGTEGCKHESFPLRPQETKLAGVGRACVHMPSVCTQIYYKLKGVYDLFDLSNSFMERKKNSISIYLYITLFQVLALNPES